MWQNDITGVDASPSRAYPLSAELFDLLTLGVVIHDPDGKIVSANPAAEKVLGLSFDQMRGATSLDPRWKAIHADGSDFPGEDHPAMIALKTKEPVFDVVMGVFNPTIQSQTWINIRAFPILGDRTSEVRCVYALFDDISVRVLSQSNQRESENLYQSLVSALSIGVLVEQRDSGIVAWNRATERILGLSAEQLMGKTAFDPDWKTIHEDGTPFPPDGHPGPVLLRDGVAQENVVIGVCKSSGIVTWISVSAAPVFDSTGLTFSRIVVSFVDITERKLAEAKAKLAASVFDHAREGITITDARGTIVEINEAFTRITGYSREEAVGQNPRFLRSGRHDASFYAAMWSALTVQGHWSGEIWNRRKDGEAYAELLTISAVRDASDAVQQYVGLFSDITAIKQHQSQLELIAHFDALTNLPNRVLLADRLQQSMAQAQRRGQQLAVVYLDLDGFKAINDQHGHDVGDQVLITLAQRMKHALREGDSMARLGGDEFVAVLIDLEDLAASRPLLGRLLDACAQPVRVGDFNLQVSASLGVTLYPQRQDIEADQLLRQADQAMYQAKVAGKNRYHIFDTTQDSSIRGHNESVERIRLALERQEFVLHYQPKVNMRSGQIIGAEALIRWNHPKKGLLAPAVFLPVIENHALAVAIGEWVIDTALTQMEIWQAEGMGFRVSVNIGARQLQQGDFVDRLKFILAKHPQVNPASLELEVLETSALEDIAQVSEVIEACSQMGVMFALDDFGTGYSSLTYLKRLRVAMLKIDQSFVRDMLDDPDDLAILQGIIGLAESFRRQVLAEGVETVAHGGLLLQLGCELAQGYGIAHPMAGAELPAWGRNWKPDPTWGDVQRVRH